ncbi:hypothetical protein [Peptoniphilus senegalensis]|mgnify:FL=1|uniref:Uncharacterized protein n=1 Tax=Peptoniphilus senegalensis TaxID=1465757 RepID=A0ABV1J0E2_9FIRM|nr:hypothetical protein PEPTYR26121_00652 [Peptoniphilus tyrrelliae]
MIKYLEISIYFIALFGYFLTKYTKIIKDEKLRGKVSYVFNLIAWLILVYEFVLKKFL